MTSRHTIVNVGYRSTNYWVISAGNSRLLVDIGWPGTMGVMRANLNRIGVPLNEIRYALATHYHMDHAGLAEELKRAGVPLLVLETQVAAIPLMKARMKPQDRYVEITLDDNVTIPLSKSREVLAKIGLAGEILCTPGHSDDSVSLLLDDGSVFTGDLTPPALARRQRRCCGGQLATPARARRQTRLSRSWADPLDACRAQREQRVRTWRPGVLNAGLRRCFTGVSAFGRIVRFPVSRRV